MTPIPEVFIDTSGWASLADDNEPYHKLTSGVYQRIRAQKRRVVTTNYIVTELISLFISPLRFHHEQVVEFITKLHESTLLDVVYIDSVLHERSWRLFVDRPDKHWSLVDCSSFVVMQGRSITEALTTDHHFEQAGYVRLLK